MIARGISELIRDTRQKTGLTTTDLANQIEIDPSSLSRLEEAKANVSIEVLSRV
jgi:ribosome-binding protein aMBF1 (putative translation factor)